MMNSKSGSLYSSDLIDMTEMLRIRQRGVYRLRQLGTDEFAIVRFANMLRDRDEDGWLLSELIEVTIRRTQYLNSIIECGESQRAITALEAALADMYREPGRRVVEVDKGHVYRVESDRIITDDLRFVKRSGGAVTYTEEWPGLQTQEVFRMLIDRCQLFDLPAETACRRALFEYEARAYRRKRQEHNREAPEHEETIFPYEETGIEKREIGDDGHIPYIESEILYYGYFGGEDPIPGADPFTVESDPVYRRYEAKLNNLS